MDDRIVLLPSGKPARDRLGSMVDVILSPPDRDNVVQLAAARTSGVAGDASCASALEWSAAGGVR
jgi:hypothetical protein